ncbi:uncharacterized protein TNCT_336531 [Trichonephila clavata]|uniref:Uncharacterized protein n=1 Tax=Trichonephila clavata TaxID=2740835 RepID=A0A8X6H139_TRICU|nr:uncharacterized protein TNCT_336531 [Trichonephila clavata]
MSGESFFQKQYIKVESFKKDHIERRSPFSVAVLKVNSHVAERNMVSTQIFLVFLSLSILVIAHGWQQSESEYNDDSLAMMPGSGWKENPEKRNTWWTKKSVRDEDVPNEISKNNPEYLLARKSVGCPLEKCMLMLLECLRRTENRTALYLQCKDGHLQCLASCFQKYKEKFMFNTVAMAS